jgi:predicted HTH transcriptional regulator
MTDTPLLDWVPYVRGSDTSRDAAESMRPHVRSIADDVLAFIREGSATCDEVEEHLALRHQTASARVRDLVKDGKIRDSGARRPTRSGRMARVYIAC